MFLDKVGINNIIEVFKNSETSSKTIQILLWIFLVQCEKSPKSKLTKSFLEDENLFRAILSLLEMNSSVVKGRVYLYIYFLLAQNFKKCILLLDSKLFHIIERQNKEGAKYETQCLQFVLVTLYENFGEVVTLVEDDIKKAVKPNNSFSANRKYYYIGILNHMINSPIFEELFEKYSNIEALISLLNLFDINC